MKKWMRFGIGILVAAGWLAYAFAPRSEGPRAPAEAPEFGPPELDHSGLAPRPLRGRVLNRSDSLGLPSAIVKVGPYLAIADRHGAAPLHVVEAATGRLIGSFGREGEGPGEFRAPWSLDPIPGRTAFWVFDLALQRLTRVELREGRPTGPFRESPLVTLRGEATALEVVRGPGGGWLAMGLFPGGRLATFDAEGAQTGTVGPLPPNPGQVPSNVLQHAYMGRLKARPDRARLVIADQNAGWLEIYGADGSPLARVADPIQPFEPRFTVDQGARGPTMASGEGLRFGYLDVAAGQDRLYALFSGRTRAGFPGRANYGEYVHVFDWDGRFLEAWRLDADAIAVAVDEAEGQLYALRHDPLPAVMEYDLPAEIGSERQEGG